MLRICRSAAVLLCLLATGCALPLDLPPGFVAVHDGSGFAAVTSDDARVSAAWLWDRSEAPVAFWAETLEHDFAQQRGYEVKDKGEVTTRDGAVGRWLECVANVGGERVGYLIAIWTSGRHLRVVEFAARAEVFAARKDAVRAALRTVRT